MTLTNFAIKPLVFIKHLKRKLSFVNKTLMETTLTKLKFHSIMPQVKPNLEFEVLATPTKSASDKKEYRVIRLKNGLTACLVSDTRPIDDESDNASDSSSASSEVCEDEDECDSDESEDEDEGTSYVQKMAAAGLCVGVGSFSDPKSVPGMAHFLEHMVFMGSEKFPKENDFDSFISKRGGSDNASTDCEHTTFYFECLERDLFTALDKFAQFFISPLMNRGSIEREREAIESEFQMAIPSDSHRKEQLLASFATNESPVNTFTWGNLITLRDNVTEDELYAGVHEFRKRHYSAHRMTLAIQARLPLDELQSYVLECFSNVPSNDLPPDDFKQFVNVFDTPQFTKIYYIQPVNQVIQLELTWALPSLLHKYKSKPHQYISFILGDEGKGSLLSYLKKKVWVLTMKAGNGESGCEHNSIYALFSISMILTVEGWNHLYEIIEIVFSYINMLKKVGLQERLYHEMKTINDTSFKFANEESAVEFVEDLCEDMHFYPPEDYITGSELFFEYDPEAIQMVLKSLIPRKMNVTVLCNKLPSGLTFDKTEKWFGTKYTEQDIPEQWLKKWQKATPLKEFALPPPNQFLTEDFTILGDSDNHPDYPEKVLKSDLIEVWYRKDQKFKLPIAYYKFYFINPIVLKTPKASALLDLYMSLLQISLAEETYPAQVALLSYSFKDYDKGLTLGLSGYNEKLHLLLEVIARHFIHFKSNLTREMFQAVKDKLMRYYYNCLLKPTSVAKDVRLGILINKYHSLMDKYNSISSITFEDLVQFSEDFISSLFIKVLVQGNVRKEHAINVVNNFVSTLKCKPIDPATYPKYRVNQIPQGETFCMVESFNTNDSNSIITNYYQCGPFSLKDSVLIDIVMLIIQEPLFDTLRTKEQLGYDVRCSSRDTFGILGFALTVSAQATKNTTQYVDERIEVFIKQATDIFTKMSEESFETIKHDLIKTKRCADVHLQEEVARNWSEIVDDDYMFDRIQQEIAVIEKVTLKETREWWKRHTSGSREDNFRKLSVQVSGFKTEGTKKGEETKDDDILREKMFLNFIESNYSDQQRTVENLNEFREKLFLYPVVSKYTISN